MPIYQRTGLEDIKLMQWWERMVISKDILPYTGLETLSSMYFALSAPTILVYEEDESGIWLMLWVEPSSYGGFIHVWIAAAERRTKKALKAILDGLRFFLYGSETFKGFEVLIGVTSVEMVADEHQKLGFVRMGVLPTKEPIYITCLTRDAFERETSRFQSLTEH